MIRHFFLSFNPIGENKRPCECEYKDTTVISICVTGVIWVVVGVGTAVETYRLSRPYASHFRGRQIFLETPLDCDVYREQNSLPLYVHLNLNVMN